VASKLSPQSVMVSGDQLGFIKLWAWVPSSRLLHPAQPPFLMQTSVSYPFTTSNIQTLVIKTFTFLKYGMVSSVAELHC
jgi:hypothetical protein